MWINVVLRSKAQILLRVVWICGYTWFFANWRKYCYYNSKIQEVLPIGTNAVANKVEYIRSKSNGTTNTRLEDIFEDHGKKRGRDGTGEKKENSHPVITYIAIIYIYYILFSVGIIFILGFFSLRQTFPRESIAATAAAVNEPHRQRSIPN